MNTSTYYVCKCGHSQNDHQFRHQFENSIKVNRKIIEIKRTREEFEIDATDFPTETKMKCSKPDCNAPESRHTSLLISHPYSPEEIKYHKIGNHKTK